MPEPMLVARSGLEHLVVPGRVGVSTEAPGVSIALVQHRVLAAVIARRNRAAELADLPRVPRVVTRSAMSFVWAGPGRWLAMAERISREAFLKNLREQFGELASVIDQSDARILVRLAGPHARDVLAKSVLIDLHPRTFHPGDTALTSFGHVRAHFWQIDAMPTYEIAVMRSYAAALWRYLMEAAARYGVLVP